MSDGSALPSWLTFNSGTKTFQGTPTVTGKLYVSYGVTIQYSGGPPAPAAIEAISTFVINI